MRCEGDRLELGRKRPSETVDESDHGEARRGARIRAVRAQAGLHCAQEQAQRSTLKFGVALARERALGRYQPRRPSQSVLYSCFQQHLETWLAHCHEGDDHAGPVRRMWSGSSRRYLECGIPVHGLARARRGQWVLVVPTAASAQAMISIAIALQENDDQP